MEGVSEGYLEEDYSRKLIRIIRNIKDFHYFDLEIHCKLRKKAETV